MRKFLNGLGAHLDPNKLGFWQMIGRYLVFFGLFIPVGLLFLLLVVQAVTAAAGHPLIP